MVRSFSAPHILLTFIVAEFIISDLALSAYAVPSFTLSSLSQLSHVLDNHSPSIIITEASFLPHVLEPIYDSKENEHHTIVVVGDIASAKMPRVDNVKILKWADVEAQGAAADKPTLPTPGKRSVTTLTTLPLIWNRSQ